MVALAISTIRSGFLPGTDVLRARACEDGVVRYPLALSIKAAGGGRLKGVWGYVAQMTFQLELGEQSAQLCQIPSQ
jgi:hypothetical protein